MNGAHLHIILVHIPVILVPLGVMILVFSIWRKNSTVAQVALAIFMLGAVAVVPAFLLGEEAEEIVEEIAGVSESVIETHEEAADVALWLTVVLGAVSALTLFRSVRSDAISNGMCGLVVLLGLTASGSLAYTAQKGGMIRHPEAFPGEQHAYQGGHEGEGDADD